MYVWRVEQLLSEKEEARRSNVFCCCIWYDIVSALVLGDDLIACVCPADVVMLVESNVARFGRDERCFGEVDGVELSVSITEGLLCGKPRSSANCRQ